MAAIKVRRALHGIGMAFALSTLCGAANAQSTGSAPSAPQSHDTAMIELHQVLGLSAQQEPAWQAYSAQLATAAQARVRQQAGARMLPTLDAPHRMDLVEAEMRQELADLHRRSEALKALYAILTPAQRQVFDQRTLPQQPQNQQ